MEQREVGPRTRSEGAIGAKRMLVHSRTLDAPPETVWRAWTEPERIARWWGPSGFETTTREMEVRTGGVWRYVMHGPDGGDYPNTLVYDEVSAPNSLSYSQRGGKAGAHFRFDVTVTFAETDGGTEVTMTLVFPTAELCEIAVNLYGAVEGGRQTLERLAGYLSASE